MCHIKIRATCPTISGDVLPNSIRLPFALSKNHNPSTHVRLDSVPTTQPNFVAPLQVCNVTYDRCAYTILTCVYSFPFALVKIHPSSFFIRLTFVRLCFVSISILTSFYLNNDLLMNFIPKKMMIKLHALIFLIHPHILVKVTPLKNL